MLFLEQFYWKCLAHPPYSPDLAPSDFKFFGPLKKHFKGKRFQCDGEIKAEVHWCLLSVNPDFLSAGIEQVAYC
jgi:histone-lysine N-methyltransferase SETMAR